MNIVIIKRLLVEAILLGLSILIGLYLFQLCGGNTRALHPDSKLRLSDSSIEAVSSEFMRRSSRLSLAHEDFRACMRARCDELDPARLNAIFVRRDEIIEAEWPAIFDRLSIADDWLQMSSSPNEQAVEAVLAHRKFLGNLRELGASNLRNRCVPLIEFYVDPYSSIAYYRLNRDKGYRCQ